MSDTITFRTHLRTNKNVQFDITVKKEFLKTCPHPEKFDTLTLNSEYYLMNYLHNTEGPAVVRLTDGATDYWMDGECLSGQPAKKGEPYLSMNPEKLKELLQRIEFNKKFT